VLVPGPLNAYLHRHAQPIRYGNPDRAWALEHYQTVFAREPGSAESPSAALGFTPTLVTRLVAAGVVIAPVLLHTGVSSQELGEPPYPERYRVPRHTAALVNLARRTGRRVVAVGTTSTRALETVTDDDGLVHAGDGWTGLVITPERGVRAVDGILTGWHEPGASHLALLEAVAGARLVGAAYDAAVAGEYLWHEHGDAALLLPDARATRADSRVSNPWRSCGPPPTR